MRIACSHTSKGFEKLANVLAIVVQPFAQFRAPCVLGDSIERDRASCPVREKAHLHQPFCAKALIFKFAANVFRPIGCLSLG